VVCLPALFLVSTSAKQDEALALTSTPCRASSAIYAYESSYSVKKL
jgi:hypothetical protein